MPQDRCWSSIVTGPADRAALRIDMEVTWPIACELPNGHRGPHASDGGRGGPGRRRWMLWDDFARTPRTARDLEACRERSIDNASCRLFDGHGGAHAFPAPRPAPARSFYQGADMAKQSKKPKSSAGAHEAKPPRPAVEPPMFDAAPMRPLAEPARPIAVPEPPAAPKPSPAEPVPTAPPAEPAPTGPAPEPAPTEPAPAPEAPVAEPAPAPHGRSSMIQINEYSDMTRTSLVEVIGPDGSARTVIAPVSAVPAAAAPRHATTTSITGSLADLEAATVEAAVAAAKLPDGEGLVRQQVGEALREVAQALSKLAESLDPR